MNTKRQNKRKPASGVNVFKKLYTGRFAVTQLRLYDLCWVLQKTATWTKHRPQKNKSFNCHRRLPSEMAATYAQSENRVL